MGKTIIDRRWLPLNALRAFEGVAKHLSFTAAANALLISQSALSRHVIALEKLIGAQLFERRPHALVLTKAAASVARGHEVLRPLGICARRYSK
jgi:LysR family glycine cleavage system transcriptional activator